MTHGKIFFIFLVKPKVFVLLTNSMLIIFSLAQPLHTFHTGTDTYWLWSVNVYWVTIFWATLIEALQSSTSISARMYPFPWIGELLFPIFINFLSVNKHWTSEETVLTLFHPVFNFQIIGVTITCHDSQKQLYSQRLYLH